MLEIKDIKLRIGEIQILNGITLSVNTGESVGIIGPNGHGKSVTMLSIVGVRTPYSGTIKFEGQDITHFNTQRIVEAGVILVPEGGHLFPDMTIMENLHMGAYSKRASEAKEKNFDLVLTLFPKLEILKNRKANTLSGGELRMLAVGRGLMGNPKLLILDEPTLGLAPNLIDEMGEALIKIGKLGTSVILSDENMDLVSDITERIYFIENGAVTLFGPTDEVLANDYVERTYLGIA